MHDPTRFAKGFVQDGSNLVRVRQIPWQDGGNDSGGGIPGPTGATGSQGAQGTQGDQGFQGEKGDQGIQGIQGSQGNQGIGGSQGPQGDAGPQGPQGTQGDKGAILYGRTKDEIVRIVCPEMPETWIFDVINSGGDLDPIFMSIIEPETICAIGHGASIENGSVFSPNSSDKILVGGIRKGFLGRRFVPQTEDQMIKSMKFWSEQSA